MKGNHNELSITTNLSDSYKILDGEKKVMISAPHCVEQTRNGHIKLAEPQTLYIANELHTSLSCPIIYKTANCNDDANYDTECAYKSVLADYIKTHNIRWLLDLHQMASHRENDIDLGTGRGKNFTDTEALKTISDIFKSFEIQNVVYDHLFSASYPFTVSSYISRSCKIQCLQIEINSSIVYNTDSIGIQRIINSLKDIVIYLNQR